ncbi:MAG: VCBS repeat-containing protein [Deltaproteobacteria bacterium]|nr:VCBS repeat-containing protein [Deltaproteobacteria bacterium]
MPSVVAVARAAARLADRRAGRAIAACALALGACDGAITLTVGGDLPVPSGVDAICVAVADRDPGGGQFGQVYPLAPPLDMLPQTLAIAPGTASAAEAWVRGYRAGFEVARDRTLVAFDGNVGLRLDRCRRGRAGAFAIAGVSGGAATRVLGSIGRGGTIAIALGGGGARVVDVDGGALTDRGAIPTDAIDAIDAVAADLDGDCDDDLVLLGASAPAMWLRGGFDFTDGGAIGAAPATAVVATDADRDGDLDLVFARGGGLELDRNDGAGRFTVDAAAFAGVTVGAVTALAAGDLDGDGVADLIVGQGGAPLVALYGTGAGYAVAAGALPAVALDVRRLALTDVEGDGDLDLAVALAAGSPRLYVNRGGRLEDQSFVRLPQPAVTARGLAIARLDDDCAPDLALVDDTGLAIARGTDGGAFADASELAIVGAADVTAIDLDDDGVPELVVAGADGVTRVAP